MTDRKPDVFFEAMLEALRGNGADVPAPNWNYEKTLVEILAELKNQNPSMEAKTETREFYSTTARYSDYFVEETVLSNKVYKYKIDIPLDYGDLPDGSVAIIDGEEYSVTQSGSFYVVTVGSKSTQTGESGYTSWEQLEGKTITIQYAVKVYPPNVLNLFDLDDPNEDQSYMPEYATYRSGEVTLSDDFDASPFYDRLKRGMPVWIRLPAFDDSDELIGGMFSLISHFKYTDDLVGLFMLSSTGEFVYTENYRPETEPEETPNINPLG